jgi:hypothetical protein
MTDQPLSPPGDSGVDLDRVWNGVTGRIWASEPGAIERGFARLLRSPALARALVATPSLYIAWTIASAIVFVLAAVMSRSADQPLVPLLAPAIAGIGVSFAYGSAADPAYEITRTMAMPERLLLLVRVVAVFGTNTLIGLIATIVTGRTGEMTILWLLPMTTVALVGLALAIVTQSATVGSCSALAIWCGFVGATFIDTRQAAAAISPDRIVSTLPVYAVLALLSAVVISMSTSGSSVNAKMKGLH